MEVKVLNSHHDGAYVTVTFKHWISGECACTAERLVRTFTKEPTKHELINSI